MPIRRTSNKSSYDSGFYNPEVYSDVGSRVVGYDSDALVYINAVEAADGQALEGSVKDAYNTFVVGCKSDGVWNAIKASCIMAGARTLSGALVPLVGVAPSGFNLASGTYSRVTGLQGDGAAMYLNSNRNNNADPQNSNHNSIFVSRIPSAVDFACYMGMTGASTSANGLQLGGTSAGTSNALLTRCRTAGGNILLNQGRVSGFKGVNRSSSLSYIVRSSSTNTTVSTTSVAPASAPITIFADQVGSTHSNAGISFYSIGESLDLALLDARVSGLMVAISGAIA